VKAENLDAMNGGWLGVFIAPTTKGAVGGGCCRMAHRTVRWCIGQSLFTVWCAFWLCSDFCVHCSALTARCRRPLALCSRYSAGAPDSPVNYSGVAPRIPEGGKFGVGFPGALDTVRWHTGQSGAPDQGTLRLSFALFI
jgi:hypothetical protein